MQYQPILPRRAPAADRSIDGDETERHLAELGDLCGDFALQCSDVAGFVNQVNQRITGDNARLAALQQSVTGLTALQAEANDAAAEIRFVAEKATTLITHSHRAVLVALGDIGALIDDVVRMGEQLEGFVEAIERVGSISGELDGITHHTRMLAINATIEAARADNGSSGFAVVAAEMKRLAATARVATASVTETIVRLEDGARTVIEDVRDGAERGRAARTRTGEITGALETIAELVTQFDQRSAAIEECGADVTRHVATLGDGLTGFARSAVANAGQLDEIRARLDGLEGVSNAMLDRVAHSGVETRDRRFIVDALAQAAEVSALIADAIADGRLTGEALFDTAYRSVPGSEPPQYLTGFVPFADAVLRPLLDRWTAADPAIVGCCLIDRNGHLPTHIRARSEAQRPGERQWNIEHARNRQIFMDRQTRAALDSDGDFRLYAYRQDFGDGRYRALRSVFVPLVFGGRKWGLYELGYLI
jgi:methyl-accepting chemotaxis protein